MHSDRQSRPKVTSGYWFVLAAATLWGTTGTSQALAPTGATPASVGAVRLALGGAALLVVALLRGTLRSGRRWPLGGLLLAAGGVAAYQLSFFGGVARTGVAIGTIVGIGSAPIMAGLLGALVRREHLGTRWVLATILAIAGCTLLIGAGRSAQVDPLGVLLALGAGVTYAFYTLGSKSVLEEQPPDAAMAVIFGLAALMLSPFLLTTNLSWLAQPRGLAVALHLGLVTVALAYILFARGLTTLQVSTTVTLTLAEPTTAGILGVAVLREPITPIALLGIGAVLAGLALLVFRREPDCN